MGLSSQIHSFVLKVKNYVIKLGSNVVRLCIFRLSVFFFKLHSKDECFERQATKQSIVILAESFFIIAMLSFNIKFYKFDWIK